MGIRDRSTVEQRMVRSVAIERRAREPTSLASAVLGRLLERCRTPDARSVGPVFMEDGLQWGEIDLLATLQRSIHALAYRVMRSKFKIANPECRRLSNPKRLRPRASTRAASSVEAKGLTRYSLAPVFRLATRSYTPHIVIRNRTAYRLCWCGATTQHSARRQQVSPIND